MIDHVATSMARLPEPTPPASLKATVMARIAREAETQHDVAQPLRRILRGTRRALRLDLDDRRWTRDGRRNECLRLGYARGGCRMSRHR